MHGILRMRYPWILQGMYKLEYGCKHYTVHLGHMFRGKDLCIYFLNKLCPTNNPCSLNIQVCSRSMDHLDSHLCTYKHHLCIERCIHTVMDCKDLTVCHLK